jgi:hypothetical protein
LALGRERTVHHHGGAGERPAVHGVPAAADPAGPGIARTELRGLYRGRVELSGGEVVHGMLGTPALIMTAGHDISEHLGWAAYFAAQTSS